MAGKKFKFRSDANNKVGLKEQVNKLVSTRGPRISVSMGLDKDLNLSNKYIMENNILVPLLTKNTGKVRSNKVTYYLIDEISYMATLTLQYNKKNKLIEKILILYVPQDICSVDEIYGSRITSRFTKEEKEEIIKNIIGYVQSKI